jgi:hypothetical protein
VRCELGLGIGSGVECRAGLGGATRGAAALLSSQQITIGDTSMVSGHCSQRCCTAPMAAVSGCVLLLRSVRSMLCPHPAAGHDRERCLSLLDDNPAEKPSWWAERSSLLVRLSRGGSPASVRQPLGSETSSLTRCAAGAVGVDQDRRPLLMNIVTPSLLVFTD